VIFKRKLLNDHETLHNLCSWLVCHSWSICVTIIPQNVIKKLNCLIQIIWPN